MAIARNFGLSVLPFAFNAGTKMVRSIMSESIDCFTQVYVDDMIGATDTPRVDAQQREAESVITALYGEGSVAVKKSERGRALDIIGWSVDCVTQRVSMSEKNARKALAVFFGVDLEEPVSIGWIRKASALATRYGVIHPEMKPYVGHLYAHLAGVSGGRCSRGGDQVRVSLSEEAKHCLRRWRAFICLQELGGEA